MQDDGWPVTQRPFALFESHRSPFNLEIPQELFEIRFKEIGRQMPGILRIKPKNLVVSFPGDPFSYDALIGVVHDPKRQRVCGREIGMHEAAFRIDGQALNSSGNRDVCAVAPRRACQRCFPTLSALVGDEGLGRGLGHGSTR